MSRVDSVVYRRKGRKVFYSPPAGSVFRDCVACGDLQPHANKRLEVWGPYVVRQYTCHVCGCRHYKLFALDSRQARYLAHSHRRYEAYDAWRPAAAVTERA